MVKINAQSQVYIILGNPIAHSLSPAMYNAAFNSLKLNCLYMASQVEEGQLQAAIQGIKALGIRGGNVTVPFKEKVIPYLDGITEEARHIGAVNTLYWERGKLWGTNTDGPGFLCALEKEEPNYRDYNHALILGAGGAARAIVVSLALAGIKNITIINRKREKALELAAKAHTLGCMASALDWNEGGLEEVFRGRGLIINTTSLGMNPQEDKMPPLNPLWLGPQHLVVDIIYKPSMTLLLSSASKRGCRTMNGIGMLLEQGILAFEKWSGYKAPVEVMKRELERWLE